MVMHALELWRRATRVAVVLGALSAAATHAAPLSDLYFTNWQAHTLGTISPSGQVTIAGVPAPGFVELDGLAFDSNGTAYVGYIGSSTTGLGGIFRVGPSGLELVVQTPQPRGIAFDDKNNLFIADSSLHDIIRVDPSGVTSTVYSFGPSVQPLRVAFDAQGQLFVAANAGVYRIDSPGVAAQIIDGVSFPSGLLPLGIAFDASGNIFVGDHYNHRVVKFDHSGSFISVFADASDGIANPWGLAIDLDGSVYVANTDTSTILGFDASGGLHTTLDASFGVDRPFSLVFAPTVPEASTSVLLAAGFAALLARGRKLTPAG
jgi:DNA-binding beta-propeller fold protein YncE